MAKVKTTFNGRDYYGTIQRTFKCARTGTDTTIINTYFKQESGEWKWSGHLGYPKTELAFDADKIEMISDFPN